MIKIKSKVADVYQSGETRIARHIEELQSRVDDAQEYGRNLPCDVFSLITILMETVKHEREHSARMKAAYDTAFKQAWENSGGKDGERWRAFIGCDRIRLIGSAGIEMEQAENYAHIGLEAWTVHPEGSDKKAEEWLIKFADKAIARKEGTKKEST